MDVQKGTQFIGFASVILGSATFGVCTWIYFTYHLGFDNQFHPAIIEGCINATTTSRAHDDNDNPINASTWECIIYLQRFTLLLIRNAGVIFITSIIHTLSAAHLLAATQIEARSRAKSWIVLQLGFIAVYFICFMSTTNFPTPDQVNDNVNSNTQEKPFLLLSTVKYFAGYCLILTFDIVIGFVLLVAALIIVRHGQNVGYSLMNL